MMFVLRVGVLSLIAAVLPGSSGLAPEPDDDEKLHAQVRAFLTDLHAAETAADAGRYLDCFGDDAIVFGTAPGERYDIEEYGSRVRRAFSGGRGRESVLLERNVGVSEGGNTAWFDELVRREAGPELRASGVLRRREAGWKIVLLDKVLPVPNGRAMELAAEIRKAVPRPDRSVPDDLPSAAVLLEFLRTGARADLDRHLACLASDAVLFGTAASERHTRPELREWLAPYFAAGQGLTSELVVLHLTESEDGLFAWFDARLDKPRLCELRGSGLLRREENGWKIVRYGVAFPVPNDLIGYTVEGTAFTTPVEVAALREDFALLRRTLEEWHPALYTYETKEDIGRLFEQAMAAIDEPMTALEFEALISPVVARVHCVHTRILRTAAHEYARRLASTYLPVEPQVIDGRLYVRTSYVGDPALVPGTELLEIDGRPADEILARLLAVISSDGRIESHQVAVLNDDFNLSYATHLGSPEKFDLRVRKPGSEEIHEIRVPALSYERWNAAVMARGPKPPPGPGQELETSIFPDEDYAVLTHRSFDPLDPAGLTRSLGEFFARLETDEIGNLIVDLRRNPGGEPEQGSLLVSYLVDEPFTYCRLDSEDNSLMDALALRRFVRPRPPAEHRFRGKVFVLIGGRNTSTAGHVIALLKQQGRATLIGQGSGATWICNDNSRDLVLPATGIQVHIARTTYRAAVTGFEPGVSIQPDHEVHRTVEAMLAGRDLEMELARRLIRQGG